MTLQDSFIQAIKKINEYSNSGRIIPETDGNYMDYRLRMPGFANDAQMKIAQFIPIPAVKSISQPQIPNLLGLHNGWDIELLLPDKGDKVYSAMGAKSFYIEVDRPCTITIEEGPNILKTIQHAEKGFTAYKGNLTPLGNGMITMKVSSTQPVQIKNRALFAYSFGTDEDVPTYQPYIPYTLESYMDFDKVYRAYDQRQLAEWSDYKKPTKEGKIYLNWFLDGEFTVHYFRLPTVIDDKTDLNYEYEVDKRVHNIIPYFIGGMVTDEFATRELLLSEFDNLLANVSRELTTPVFTEIQNVYGGW